MLLRPCRLSSPAPCRTGEVEELNLQEIANEGHMSLIEPL
jgi:hypothetical protein